MQVAVAANNGNSVSTAGVVGGGGNFAEKMGAKTTAAAQQQQKTFRMMVADIYKRQGWRGFYVGFGTTVARETPFAFIEFPIYEELKRIWADWQGTVVSPLQGALCGSVAGTIKNFKNIEINV